MTQSESTMMKAMDVALLMVSSGVLEVRPDGTVWRLRNLNTTPLCAPRRAETRSKARGYLLVRVNHRSRAFLVSAHRLVWSALRGEIPAGLDINHIDGIKTNNHPDNLELATRSENLIHALRTGLRVNRNVSTELAEPAATLRKGGLSFAAIGAELGVSQTTAFNAVKRWGSANFAQRVERRVA